MFQRVGFSSSASVSLGGMSGAEEGAGQQPLQCSSAPPSPGSSLFREQLRWGGGSVPLITGQLEGDPDTPNPARLLAHRIAC